MTTKTDLCILLFGDRKGKHVDGEENARVYSEAVFEIKRLRAENEALNELIKISNKDNARLRAENEALREALKELLYARTDKAERMANAALRGEGE